MNQPANAPHLSCSAPSSAKKPRKKHIQAVSDGRRAALEVLLLLEQGAQVQAALDAYLRNASLKPQDRALCTELVYGFLRAEIRVDFILHSLLRNPAKLPREMYLAMGLAVYALLFLERIPEHATVNWTVGQVRQRFGEALSKVANGALRAFVRQGDAPKNIEYYLPKNCKADQATALQQRDSLFFSVPLWIVRLWTTAYGAAACQSLLQRSATAPHSCVRVNARSAHAQALCNALRAAPAEDSARSLNGENSIASDALLRPKARPGHAIALWGVAFAAGSSPRSVENAPLSYWQQQGDISFQSAGSQFAMDAVQPHTWPQPVWDMCVGQGGKSCLLYEQGVDIALCTDVHLQRLESFTGNMQRIALAFAAIPETVGSGAAHSQQQALSRQQAQSIIDKMQTTVQEKIHCLAYPALKNLKKPQLDDQNELDDIDVDEYGHTSFSTKSGAGDTLQDVPSADALAAEMPQAGARSSLPLVALVDGCHAPAKSWRGTIFIDAPCSGLGVLSRRPDIRRARTEQSLAPLLESQAQLLEAAWNCLLPGGALVYMTCTLNPAENQDQMSALQKKHPEVQIVQQWQSPHEHPWLEGMFVARCVKPA